MVYASNLTIRDEDEDDTEDVNKPRVLGDCRSEEKGTNNDHATYKPRSNASTSNENGENSGAKHSKEGEKELCVVESTQQLNSLKRTRVKILIYHLGMICRLRHRSRHILMIQTRKLQNEICNDFYILSWL